MDFSELTEQIQQAVRDCGQIILHASRTADMVTEKDGHANFVTTYDKKVQEQLKLRLLAILPDAKFIGEEEDNGRTTGELAKTIMQGYVFIVDPIDGTTNFIKD